jgi:HlyD family secretion protein
MTDGMDNLIEPPWWRRKRLALPAIFAGVAMMVLVVGVVLWGTRERSLRVQEKTITISTVVKDSFHDFVPLHGSVAPKDVIYLDALEGGQVAKVLVQAGDKVTEGQELIVFRNTALELQVLSEEGRLAESITQIQTYRTTLEINRATNGKTLAGIQYNIDRLDHDAARSDALLKVNAVSKQTNQQLHDELKYYRTLLPLQMTTNRLQEKSRRQQLPELEKELISLQKSLIVTQHKIKDLIVTAPVTGQITSLNLKIGENRNRGERLAEIRLDTGFKISADVDEYYLSRVRPKQYADADIDGRTYRLRVTRVYPQVKNGVFSVDLDFAGKAPPALTPGAAVQGKLSLGTDRPGLILPAGPFLEGSGGDYVFVIDGGGKRAHKRRIKIGRRNIEQVEVLSGLEPGDKVITSDYSTYDKIDRIDIER